MEDKTTVISFLRKSLTWFWFGEVFLFAISGVVFAGFMSLVAYALSGSPPTFDRVLLMFAIWFGGFFFVFLFGGLPAKFSAWRQFRRLPTNSQTRETAVVMLQTELTKRDSVRKAMLDRFRRH